MPRAGDCGGLFRGSGDHKREERVALELGLKDGLSTFLCGISSRGSPPGVDIETLRTTGSRRVGGSLRWGWSWQEDEDALSSLNLTVKDWQGDNIHYNYR